ncbi:MAG: response regulator transcription factor [Ichthyobacteriaceae bacterium]|nr:response regulator transcription factor [Ichthyobacteriaceae bacterium]
MKITIVDDQSLFAQGLQGILQKNDTVSSVDIIYSGKEAIEKLPLTKPDIVFLDLNMPEISGFDVLESLKHLNIKPYISVLSMYKDSEVIKKSKRFGANAYLSKDASVDELYDVIGFVNKNKKFYVGNNLKLETEKGAGDVAYKLKITNREEQILRLLINGENSIKIGEELNISRHTVDRHRKNIRKKLNVSTTSEMISFVLKENILSGMIPIST